MMIHHLVMAMSIGSSRTFDRSNKNFTVVACEWRLSDVGGIPRSCVCDCRFQAVTQPFMLSGDDFEGAMISQCVGASERCITHVHPGTNCALVEAVLCQATN